MATMVGAGLPGNVVYGFKKGTLDGRSPVTMITSAGLEPGSPKDRMTFTSRNMKWLYEIWNFVLWADKDSNYYESDAETLIDKMALIVLDTIEAYDSPKVSLVIPGRSRVISVEMTGWKYLWEAVPVTAHINS
jgi:hypothetical protein